MFALTRLPSSSIAEGLRTHIARVAIDAGRALEQHRSYCRMLSACGVDVRTLDASPALPDATFIEDTAIVLDEIAVLTSMGSEARRGELPAVATELAKIRELARIEPPALIDGGDVLRLDRTLLVGVSARTNKLGIEALEPIVRRFGYKVAPVPVRGCLHLKTACTALPDGRLLINPSWVTAESLHPFGTLAIPDAEPWGANVLLVGETVCAAAEHAVTMELIERRGFVVRTTPLSEFAKAEGGATCLSLLY
jgi:dimethylargininase